ncbi:hypothetical protein B1992_12070 [Pseudoxanthomonas broegbernensis]|uniref:Secreted protein n=1 Tax=Pseudoxanthomonas broegbernensis TaxID=83619 RepID=A0A7V8GL30_9GAMM|nr:hypothetical protein [Pseudoxanthomonas broegbernensis]KAF1685470.1 hypothetical protein B1992_12070 [Pseudoxanthomonas broegbernensis]MBB6064395.1 hypothetical protein [Pseudoxanthomonas broegbernensis]
MHAFAVAGLLALTFAPAAATAAVSCSGSAVPQPLQLPSTVVAPVAPELGARASQLGMPSGVLAPASDASQSLDRVLLRLRIEGCRNVAQALPAAPVAANPDDPAAYKPQTEFDNTPWRFDMSQGGKRMTADEFDAWMKARGVRVAKGAPSAAPAEAPVAPAATE